MEMEAVAQAATETVAEEPAESVAEAVASELTELGVDRVFGLPGGEVLALIDALRRAGVEYVVCRHEADAGIMAAVYGKLTRTVGVALTTLGPGAANLMLPVSNSLLDREPLLAISAQVPGAWSWDRTHQRLPLLECYRPLTKLAGTLTPVNCRTLLRAASEAATAEPQGPVFLTLSADDALSRAHEHREPNGRNGRRPPPKVGSSRAASDELRRRLAAAERPIVVVGMGIRGEHSPDLRRWLQRWGLPVAVTPKVKGIVDETAPSFVGVVGGMAADALMREALGRSDLVVGLGLDPAEIDGLWHTELPMLWALDSAWATGVLPKDNLLAADHQELLALLAEDDAPRTWTDHFVDTRRRRAQIYRGSPSGPSMAPADVVRALADAVPAHTTVATDVGSHKFLVGQFWPSRHPETFFMSNGLSGMGYGLPAAIGAKLARPEAPVLAIVGDGGFSMNSQELETARRVGAPIAVVVLADCSYSLIRLGQEARGLERYGVDFDPIDSVQTAQACGVRAVRAEAAHEAAAYVAEALERREPIVVEVPIDADGYRGIV